MGSCSLSGEQAANGPSVVTWSDDRFAWEGGVRSSHAFVATYTTTRRGLSVQVPAHACVHSLAWELSPEDFKRYRLGARD